MNQVQWPNLARPAQYSRHMSNLQLSLPPEESMSKTITFEELSKLLSDNHIACDDIASITHFLQTRGTSASRFFSVKAKIALNSIGLNPNDLNVRWTVPFAPRKDPKFTFIDLFAGIGGMRVAFQNLGGKCVFTSEWDKSAQRTYFANFGEMPFGDITQVNESEVPNHDQRRV